MGISLAGSNPARSELLSEGTIVSVNSSCGAFIITRARLAQSVEHQTFNLRVKGSSPLSGARLFERPTLSALHEQAAGSVLDMYTT